MTDDARPDIKLNTLAFARFNDLRSRLKLDLTTNVLKKHNSPFTEEEVIIGNKNIHQLTNDDFNALQQAPALAPVIEEIKEEVAFVDHAMDFLEKLDIASELKLAIGLIISGGKAKNRMEIIKSIDILSNFNHEKAWRNNG